MHNCQTNANGQKLVTVIPGDGIGPEVIKAARRVIDASGAQIAWEVCDAGAQVFARGLESGVPRETISSIERTRVVLKGPLETPVGHGAKSANVTLRKLFETFGNVRPVREMPGVKTPYTGRGIDLVVVRENVEDLYAGIEHMQTPSVAQCLKLMSRPGCEKIVRLAFEVAVAEGRRSVHCATKANIMKLTEGLLKRTFEEVAREYPHIHAEHIIVDNCAHLLVRSPETFDVIVTSNMNGDILSDLTSGLIGGLGFAPGANLGKDIAIFEAVHGSAPNLAGTNRANPTAVMLSGVMMLRHLGELKAAEGIEHALFLTLEHGIMTRDAAGDGESASTTQFADAVIRNLGRRACCTRLRDHRPLTIPSIPDNRKVATPASRSAVGIDIFIESSLPPTRIGTDLDDLFEDSPLRLKMISNRGVKVYPASGGLTDCVDHFRCRFLLRQGEGLSDAEVLDALRRVGLQHRWVHVEKLEMIDGEPAYTKAQGED